MKAAARLREAKRARSLRRRSIAAHISCCVAIANHWLSAPSSCWRSLSSAALVFWLLRLSPDTPNTAATTTPTMTRAPCRLRRMPTPPTPAARGRLLSLLSPGYPSEACKPAALPKDALAKLSC